SVARISAEDEEERVRSARIGDRHRYVCINTRCERDVSGSEQRPRRGVEPGFGAPAQAGRGHAVFYSSDVRKIHRVEADETPVTDIGDVQPTVHVPGRAGGYAAVGCAKFSLLVARGKSKRGGARKS